MEFTQKQTVKLVCILLFLTVITQAMYTLLYVVASDVPRLWLWSLEGLVFVLLAAIAGSAFRASSWSSGGFFVLRLQRCESFTWYLCRGVRGSHLTGRFKGDW